MSVNLPKTATYASVDDFKKVILDPESSQADWLALKYERIAARTKSKPKRARAINRAKRYNRIAQSRTRYLEKKYSVQGK